MNSQDVLIINASTATPIVAAEQARRNIGQTTLSLVGVVFLLAMAPFPVTSGEPIVNPCALAMAPPADVGQSSLLHCFLNRTVLRAVKDLKDKMWEFSNTQVSFKNSLKAYIEATHYKRYKTRGCISLFSNLFIYLFKFSLYRVALSV